MTIAPAPRASDEGAPAEWLSVGDRGAMLVLRGLFALANLVGRRLTRVALWPVIAWHAVFRRRVWRLSRAYLERLRGAGQARSRDVFRHLLRFAQVALDRAYLLQGREDLFQITSHGPEHLRQVAQSGRGAILLGAHLGSVEALRLQAVEAGLPFNVVGYFQKAGMINSLLEHLNPEVSARVIDVVPESVDFILRIKDRLAAGELVAMLGDRVIPGDRAVEVDFLGGSIRVPSGPFVLASVLRCPVLFSVGLHTPPDRYDLYCEPFAERIELPRKARAATIQRLAQRYADRVAHYCRLAPDNWFNFYDLWSPPE